VVGWLSRLIGYGGKSTIVFGLFKTFGNILPFWGGKKSEKANIWRFSVKSRGRCARAKVVFFCQGGETIGEISRLLW
jgi:hypothetical protein